MDDDKLTRNELIERLKAEQDASRSPEAHGDDTAQRERLLHEVRVHQLELEAQNQALREAQGQLEESRSRYVDLYDFAPIPYCTFDRNGIVLEINLTGATMLGKHRSLIIGKPFLVLVRLDNPDSFARHIRNTLESATPVMSEITFSTESGPMEVQLVSAAVRNPHGAPTACRTAFLDISQRRLAEREARAAHGSERALRSRLEGIDRASAAASAALAKLSGTDVSEFLQVIVDHARAIVHAEYAALGIGGGSGHKFDPWVFSGMDAERAAAIGRTPKGIGLLGAVIYAGRPIRLDDLRAHGSFSGFPPHHPPMTSFLGVPVRYQGQSRGTLYLANKKGGEEFTEEDQILIEMLADRAGVAMEIARLHQVEAREHAAAKLNGDRLASAIESIEDPLGFYDADERLVLCNSAYRCLVGPLFPEPLIGRTYAEILDAWLGDLSFSSEAERASFCAERPAERHASKRLEVRTRDERNLRIMNRRTIEAGIVQTIWDLTDDVRREQELRDARRAADAASAAKSEFLSSMSHELRTPLNAILGFAQLLERDKKTPLSDRHRERLAHILKGGEHLLHLVDEVLDLACIEAGRVSVSLEPVALAELLAEIRTTLDPMTARAEIELIVDEVPEHMMVTADRTRLKQILMSYGSNAIKYGRKGGKARFHASQSGGCVRISVLDDGIGIALDKQDQIFQPFQRAGQEAGPIEGTGIGLAITKRLAGLMAGNVGFRSTEGQGSAFWIELPVHRATMGASAADQPALGAGGSALTGSEGARYLIVCIEDSPANIAFMKDLLADFERIEMVVAPTADLGIEIVRTLKPNAVIMDINLPGMNGFEATRRLAEWPETRDIPVIALSAAAKVNDAARVRDAGFYRYLTKPVKVDELALVLEELLLPRLTASSSRT
jgi:PAS domain S-box-containing protein